MWSVNLQGRPAKIAPVPVRQGGAFALGCWRDVTVRSMLVDDFNIRRDAVRELKPMRR
jgi:hypothetical protein